MSSFSYSTLRKRRMDWKFIANTARINRIISSVLLLVALLQCIIIPISNRHVSTIEPASLKVFLYETPLEKRYDKKSGISPILKSVNSSVVEVELKMEARRSLKRKETSNESIEHKAFNNDGETVLKMVNNREKTKRELKMNDEKETGHEETDDEDENSICLSPERKVDWILDGTCMDDPYLPSFSTGNFKRSCGFCGKGTDYLRALRDDIAAKYYEKCKELVVYGAALGGKHEYMLRSTEFLGTQSIESRKHHNTCFFQFTTDSKNTGDELSADGSQILIVVDPKKLPYENNRRNTKLFKYSPGLLFPWAKRIIWEDAKLLQALPQRPDTTRYTVPSDYLYHFNRTVERFGTCTSYMSLPLHKASVGEVSAVTLRAHCDTIIAAVVKRPTVSDSLDVVRKQCDLYEEMYKNATDPSGQVYAQNPLTDTAFIVYDMRSSSCKKFIGDFGCSMMDEIHCYSDRDQLSYPAVMASSGLKIHPESDVKGLETRDRVYVNDNNVPMLHMAKRSCHWYYGNFHKCATSDKEITLQRENRLSNIIKPGKLNIAIIVAGSMNRLMFHSSLENLIKPMAKEYRVDYYGSFITKKPKPYRSNLIYPNHFEPDSFLPNTKDTEKIKRFIRRKISQFGGNVEALDVREIVDIDSEPMLQGRRTQALRKYPKEKPDTRFPMLDVRSQAIASITEQGNENLLRMHFAIHELWNIALQVEEEDKFKYDYVIFMRDDSHWLEKFNITNLHDKQGDVFVPSCDDRDPPLDPVEENDHILISRRKYADVFGNYYKVLFDIDMDGCMNRLSDKIKKKGKRGCNSEMLVKWVLDKEQMNVTRLNQSEIPFQRTANVRLPDGSTKMCFHKFCQSKESPLPKHKIELCKDIDWKKLYHESSTA